MTNNLTVDLLIKEVQDAIEHEMQKKPLSGPSYNSSHIVTAVSLGERIAEERIIKLLEQQFANSYWSDLSPQYIIALIKGEK